MRRSHATTVSRWSVMPMAAIGSSSAAGELGERRLHGRPDLAASCSTQPGLGEVLGELAVREAGRRRRRRATAKARTPVVPASMAITTDIGGRTLPVASRIGTVRRPGGATMRVAMLTGGGDCPGLNAVMRAVARKGERIYGDELIGFLDGWRGVLEGRYTVPLGAEAPGHAAPRRHDPRVVRGEPYNGRRPEQVRRHACRPGSTPSSPSVATARSPSATA